jgi:hypothetical protein
MFTDNGITLVLVLAYGAKSLRNIQAIFSQPPNLLEPQGLSKSYTEWHEISTEKQGNCIVNGYSASNGGRSAV